jgi:flagellar hook-associated protein FlgK
MSDGYFHDDPLVVSVINNLTKDLAQYNSKIAELVSLVNTMNESSSWKDELVKTSFISKANEYIESYKKFATYIEGFIKYLQNKNNKASELERAYS